MKKLLQKITRKLFVLAHADRIRVCSVTKKISGLELATSNLSVSEMIRKYEQDMTYELIGKIVADGLVTLETKVDVMTKDRLLRMRLTILR